MLSVIIPTCNAGAGLAKLLEAVGVQTVRPAEVLVIDSASTDETVRMAEAHGARVISILPSAFDHGGTRTLAARQARGEILLFLTQDAVPAHPDCFETLLRSFRTEGVAAAYGRQIPAEDASVFARHLRAYNYPAQAHLRWYEDRRRLGLKAAFLSNSFAAYRKQDLAAIGYFETGLIFGEDMLAGARLLKAGKLIAYNADARVIHSHNYSVGAEFRRYFDMGVMHRGHRDLLDAFGSAGKEGVGYVKSELAFLAEHGKYHLLAVSLLRSAAKYAGYRCGRGYRFLPRRLNRRIGLNHSWWDRKA